MMMKAACVRSFGGGDRLEVTAAAEPMAAAGEVVVEVRAAGLNFSDVLARRGEYPGGPVPPYRPGVEGAGIVGDRRVAFVCRGGAHASRVAVPEAACIEIPDSMSFEQAAAFPVSFLTAHHALTSAGAKPGETVLVTAAAGALGIAAITLARRLGLRVVGAASTEAKRAFAVELGADQAVDYAAIDALGDRPSIVIETVGGSVYKSCARVLAESGRIVLVGCASGESPQIDPIRLIMRSQSVIGLHLRSFLGDLRAANAIADLFAAFAAGELPVHVGHVIALDDIARAHEMLESRLTTGKVVLIP